MKPGTPALHSSRLLDQLRERIRYMHYSLRTEKVYVYWVRFFVRWSARGGSIRQPRDMGAADVEAFLSMLTSQRRVSVSTHNQALSALLFLYREVLGLEVFKPRRHMEEVIHFNSASASWRTTSAAIR